MAVSTFTKSGSKATTPARLDKNIFGLEVKNHQLLKDAYLSIHASSRQGGAKTKSRGEVRGGGRKPWRQKGTGNARFGSSRNPIWRGGGVAFGPTGNENFNRKLSTTAKSQALKQALSLAASEDRVKVIDSVVSADGKVQAIAQLLKKLGAEGSILIVTAKKDDLTDRATRNLPKTSLVEADYLNVFDVLNADGLILTKDGMSALEARLGGKHA